MHPLGINHGPNRLLAIRSDSPLAPGPVRGVGILSFLRPELWGVSYHDYTQTYQDGFRVADTSLDVYELYVGEDAPVDFTASGQPVATSATLPFSWTPTPPGAGTKVLHVVVRKRNQYDLVGFNVYEALVEINTSSVQQLGPITAPVDVAVYDAASGYIRVVSKYFNSEDLNPADTWEIYVKIGSDPVVGVDPVTYTGAMVFFGAEAGVAQTLGPYTPGTVAHVRVVSMRDSDDERASAAVVQFTLGEGLDLGPGILFGGTQYEQR